MCIHLYYFSYDCIIVLVNMHPRSHHDSQLQKFVHVVSVAHFLESRGMTEDALEVATDPDYRFELAIQLGRLEVAKVSLSVLPLEKLYFLDLPICCSPILLFWQDIAVEAQSESKWKQLGELAMSTGKVTHF